MTVYDRAAERRRMILTHYLSGKTAKECAELTGFSVALCQKVIANYELRHQNYINQQRKQPPPTFQNELNPSPFYDNHDEYSRHWAGVEKEDNRKKQDRGKAWPPKGWHPIFK